MQRPFNRLTTIFFGVCLAVAIVLISFSRPALAQVMDLNDAALAINRGDYATALPTIRFHAERLGNADAQFLLGALYAQGKGVAQNYPEAIKWYRKAAEAGSVLAQADLGYLYSEGKGVSQNFPEALKWTRKAAEAGNATAQNSLGFMYDNGQGVKKDPVEAVRWYRKAAEQGLAVAQSNLAYAYENGEGVRQDDAEALRWSRLAADQGNFWSQMRLGDYYKLGRGVAKDSDEAKRWYGLARDNPNADADNKIRATSKIKYINDYTDFSFLGGDKANEKYIRALAENGDLDAQYGLCFGLSFDADSKWLGEVINQRTKEAHYWWSKAAENGHGESCLELTRHYANGDRVKKDVEAALRYARKAAEADEDEAMKFLADVYFVGWEGTPNDYTESYRWYKKLADGITTRLSSDGEVGLGDLFLQGKGVIRDDSEALRWYMKSVETRKYFDNNLNIEFEPNRGDGTLEGMIKLGFMYAIGRGTASDPAEATKWWRQFDERATKDKWTLDQKQDRISRAMKVFNSSEMASIKIPRSSIPKAFILALDSLPRDQEPPLLTFAQNPRVEITQGELTLNGNATDVSGVAELMVNGHHLAYGQGGEFSYKRFYPLGETVLEFKATDSLGNTTAKKVTVVRQAVTPQMSADEPQLTPPPGLAKINPNALALIVGVEDYRSAPKAKFAAQDAALFYDYAQRTLGIPAANIKLLTGEQATRTGLLTALKTWLVPMITPGKSQVVVYFAGHGLAASEGDKAFLIPQDGDPSLLDDTALDRQRLFDEISKAKPLSATLFFDTCYSGGARGGEGTLVANARPVMIKSKAATLPPGFMQFSAASNDQLAHSHPSQQHGLFSYYLMRGLSGEADANKDNKLTAGELQDYVQEKVRRMALTQGRPQDPELMGERNRVIAVWNR